MVAAVAVPLSRQLWVRPPCASQQPGCGLQCRLSGRTEDAKRASNHRQLLAGGHRRRRPQAPAAAAGPQPADITQLKQQLMQAVSRANNPQRGDNLLALDQAVEAAAEALARANPTPEPTRSPLLLGAWALLYSGRSRRLAESARATAAAGSAASGLSLRAMLQAASDRAYSTFYANVPLLAGSAVGARARGSQASNQQVLLADRPGGGCTRVDNVVTARAGPLPLRICVSGSVEAVSPSCVAVRFDGFRIRAGAAGEREGGPEAALPLGWLRPLGFVDTLYLDADMRVSVGDKGGLFVLRRAGGGSSQAG